MLILCPECRILFEREDELWFVVCPTCGCKFQIEEESKDADK